MFNMFDELLNEHMSFRSTKFGDIDSLRHFRVRSHPQSDRTEKISTGHKLAACQWQPSASEFRHQAHEHLMHYSTLNCFENSKRSAGMMILSSFQSPIIHARDQRRVRLRLLSMHDVCPPHDSLILLRTHISLVSLFLAEETTESLLHALARVWAIALFAQRH